MQLIIECFDNVQTWVFFRQIWRKNQQSPVIYSVSIWHDLHTYIDRHEVYIYIYISHTPEVNRKSQTERRHMARRNTLNQSRWGNDGQSNMTLRLRDTFAHDTPAAYHVHTWTHQQRTMCTHEHTSSAPCVHMNTPAAYHVYTSTHQQRTMCTHQHTSSVPCVHMNTNVDTPHPTPPHPTPRTMCTHQHTSSVPCVHMNTNVDTPHPTPRTMSTHQHTSSAPCVHINTPAAYHVYTSTHQQRTMCTHEHQRWHTHPTPRTMCTHQHTSSAPCVHMNTPAAHHVYTSTHQQRTMCTHQHTSSVPCVHMNTNVDTPHPTPPHPTPPHVPCVHINTPAAYHVYTWTHQQRTMCTHQHTSSVPCVHMNTNVDTPHPTPRTMCTHQHTSSVPCVHMNTNVDTPHPTPPHMLKFRANPPGRPIMLYPYHSIFSMSHYGWASWSYRVSQPHDRSLVGGLGHEFYFSIQLGISYSQLTVGLVNQHPDYYRLFIFMVTLQKDAENTLDTWKW